MSFRSTPCLSCDWCMTLPVWHIDADWVRGSPSHCLGAISAPDSDDGLGAERYAGMPAGNTAQTPPGGRRPKACAGRASDQGLRSRRPAQGPFSPGGRGFNPGGTGNATPGQLPAAGMRFASGWHRARWRRRRVARCAGARPEGRKAAPARAPPASCLRPWPCHPLRAALPCRERLAWGNLRIQAATLARCLV